MLGFNERFDAVPFFWSQHYDVPINYVGHTEQWDEIDVDGDIESRDCVLRYRRNVGRRFNIPGPREPRGRARDGAEWTPVIQSCVDR